MHCQAALSMESSRQDYWSGLQFPSPGDLSNPGIELRLLNLYRLSYKGSPVNLSIIYLYNFFLKVSYDTEF